MTSWSGFWGDSVSGNNSHALLVKRSPNRYHLARMLKRRGMREYSEVLATLVGAAAGSSASVALSRVQGVADPSTVGMGGVRPIESVQLVGLKLDSARDDASPNTARNTTAADITAIAADLPGGSNSKRAPSTYPVDRSSNGGGGKHNL